MCVCVRLCAFVRLFCVFVLCARISLYQLVPACKRKYQHVSCVFMYANFSVYVCFAQGIEKNMLGDGDSDALLTIPSKGRSGEEVPWRVGKGGLAGLKWSVGGDAFARLCFL